MTARKKKSLQKAVLGVGKVAEDAVVFLLVLTPFAAVLGLAYCFVVLTTPELTLWAAIIVGLVLSFAIVRAVSGPDFKEFVPPGVLLIFAFILLPVFVKAKANALRHKHHAPHARFQAPAKTP